MAEQTLHDDAPQLTPLTYAYVVVPGMVAGMPVQPLQLDGNKLSRVFGKLGPSNVAQMPNGIIVMLGEWNRLVLEALPAPKITFQGTSPDVLYTLYQNAKNLVLGNFMSQKATAFGVNIEYDARFLPLDARRWIGKLQSDKLPHGATMTSAVLVLENTTYNIQISTRDPELVYIGVTKETKQPGIASFDHERLKREIETLEQESRATINELSQCLRKQNA